MILTHVKVLACKYIIGECSTRVNGEEKGRKGKAKT